MRKIISLFVAALFSAAMFATTYTVVGDGCGLTWDQTSSVNDMTADGNVFKLVKTDVELTAGTINYKIVENHSWDKSYPQEGNANFKIEKSGKYDVTFTLDLAATPEYSVLAELKEEVDVLPSIQMHGNFTGTWADTEEFEVAEDKKSASLKLNLDVKTFEFGMRIGGPGNWTANGAVITRENPSTSLATGSGNMKLTADLAGEYVFTYTYETQTLAVTFPEGEIIPVEHTYTVAGTPASLFGTEWDPSNTENDMTKQEDGSYKWEKKDLALEAGLIKFKVVEDHDWANPNYPSEDYELNITEAATYTLTITFNNGEVAAQALKDGEAPVEQAKFYVTGNKALVGEELEWKPNALKSMTDTLELSLEAGVDYQLKVTLNGTWTEGDIRGFNDLSEKAEGLNDVGGDDHNIGFRLAENGIVKVVYIAAANEDSEIFKLIGNFSTEEPPVTADGFYLVGTITGWEVVPDAPHTFQTTAVEGEYILHFTLADGDAIKVVGVENGVETWYPEGMGTEYTVDAAHAGEKDIYFRPAGNAEWAAFGGFIYIAPNAEEAIIINTEDGIKAVKVIENGQMVIIKAGVRYNVLGTRL